MIGRGRNGGEGERKDRHQEIGEKEGERRQKRKYVL